MASREELQQAVADRDEPYMGEAFYELAAREDIDFYPSGGPAMTFDTLNYLEIEEGECAENALRRRFGLPSIEAAA